MPDSSNKPKSSGRRRKPSPGSSPRSQDGPQRLQKVLAACGVGSRRSCEVLIEQGRVEVDRQIVTVLGSRVDPATAEIRVDGNIVRTPRRCYFLVNKPSGVLATNADPRGRNRVIDIVDSKERLFTVGRLDRMSEGLILVTNDGELANRLAHPRYGVTKTYRVRVAGRPTREKMEQVKQGVYLSDGLARVDELRIKRRFKDSTEMEMILSEGRNREIRRVLARVGHKVLTLRRIGLGPLRLGRLPAGGFRELTPSEVSQLRKLVAGGTRTTKTAPQRKSRSMPAGKAGHKKESTRSQRNRGNVRGAPRARRAQAGSRRGRKPGK